MAIQKPGLRLGTRIKYYRERAGLSQEELADATGLKRTYLSSVEQGRIKVVYPEDFNAIVDVVEAPGYELLECMGYRTGMGGDGIAPKLRVLLTRMTDEQQEGLAKLVRVWAAENPSAVLLGALPPPVSSPRGRPVLAHSA